MNLRCCVGWFSFISWLQAQSSASAAVDSFEQITCNIPHVTIDAVISDKKTLKAPVVLGPRNEVFVSKAPWIWDQTTFLERYGNVSVGVRDAGKLYEIGHAGQYKIGNEVSTVSEYFGVAGLKGEDPGLIFQNEYSDLNNLLRRQYSIPKGLEHVHRKPIVSLSVNGTGVGFHSHSINWLAQLRGRKAWWLLRPEAEAAANRAAPGNPCRFLHSSPNAVEAPPKNAQMCIVEPGEVIVVPTGYFHATCNLDDYVLAVGWEGDVSRWPPHMHAIADGDVDSVQKWLAAADLGKLDAQHEKTTALGAAALAGHKSIVEHLLAARANPAISISEEKKGFTAAHAAAVNGFPDVLKALANISKKTLVARDKQGAMPIHFAAMNGHGRMLKLLLQGKLVKTIEAMDGQQHTALYVATESGHVRAVRSLLEARADATREIRGETPAIRAAKKGHVGIIGELLQSSKRIDSHSIMDAALQEEQQYVALWLLHKGGMGVDAPIAAGDMQPLHVASAHGHTKMIELLVAEGAKLEVTEKIMQATPLHIAAYKGHLRAAQALVSHGAKVQAKNKKGETPSQMAQTSKHKKVADFLKNTLKAGREL